MGTEPEHGVSNPPASVRGEILIAVALVLLCLLPFLNKAFHIDDPLFLWTAQQIEKSPGNFYGFDVNWSGTAIPMSQEMKNPPLTSYYQAAVARVAGFRELAMHLAFLPFAVATVVGVVLLARRLAGSGLLAGVLMIASPAFLVSSTSVMSDGMMLALWTWAVLLWIWGLDRQSALLLIGSGVLVAAAALTKYPAMNLVPLLLAYGLLRRRMWVWQGVALLIPLAALVAYQVWTAKLYGHGLVTDAGKFAIDAKPHSFFKSAVVGLAFVGGSALGPALVIATLSSWRGWIFAAIVGLVALVTGLATKLEGLVLIQFVLLAIAGAAVLAAAWRTLRTQRTADAALLALWIGGVFVFAAFVNWTINARSVLAITPAAAILATRCLKLKYEISDWNWRRSAVSSAISFGLVISLWVTIADYRWAGASRALTEKLRDTTHSAEGQVWFSGHWGFMWYMQPLAKSIDGTRSVIEPGDWIVMYLKTSDPSKLPAPAVLLIEKIEAPAGAGASMAGFYSDAFGATPFVIGTGDVERVAVFQAKARLKLGPDADKTKSATKPSPPQIVR
jgi:4-amino-4-deoxy-L-arabinose transferase-like glycosyltransferase